MRSELQVSFIYGRLVLYVRLFATRAEQKSKRRKMNKDRDRQTTDYIKLHKTTR